MRTPAHRPRHMRTASLLLVAGVLLGIVDAGYAVAAPSASGGTVFLQTVPALGGVHVSVASQVVTTGPDGSATLPVSNLNEIASTVALAGDQLDATDSLKLVKVQPGPHVTRESHLTLGLDVTSHVRLRIDPADTGVPATTIRSVNLHSITGERVVADPQQSSALDLTSRRTRLENGVLTTQVVTWSVDSVRAASGVAVRAAQPAFDPFGQSTWALKLAPVRGTVVVDTVPKTSGVSFALEGATITTGPDGRGQGVVGDLNAVAGRIQLASATAGTVSVALQRVAKLPSGAPYRRHVLAVLTVRHPVSLTFKDASGAPVPSSRITEVRLQGGGNTIILKGADVAEPVSLVSSVATQVERIWRPRQVTYSVTAVTMDGSDAVFAGRQRFNPNAARWSIALAVFNVKVTVRDVVFGRQITSSAWVTRPDGQRFQVDLGKGGATVLTSLVRGNYDLQALSAVYGSHTKLLVSRNDVVKLRVVTRLDLIVMILALVALAGSVIVLGRILRKRRTPRSGGATHDGSAWPA